MIFEEKQLQSDFKYIYENFKQYENLRNRTILVTGATGLIGNLLVKSLFYIDSKEDLGIKLVIMARDEAKVKKVYGNIIESKNVSVVISDVNNGISFDDNVDYIIHAASPTSSSYFVNYPVDTLITSVMGTKAVLDFAVEKQVKGMVYLSSLEVYGEPNHTKELKEEESGYINQLNPRSSYSEGKRAVECLCAAYAQQYGLNVTVARLSQTFGAGVEYNDTRVFAEFARSVVEKEDIVLMTPGNTIRSYCYTADAVTGILYIMVKGLKGEAYNVTNSETAISIKEMAEIVASLNDNTNVRMNLNEDVSNRGFNPEMIIRLDTTKLHSLGWRANIGLKEMYVRLLNSWGK